MIASLFMIVTSVIESVLVYWLLHKKQNEEKMKKEVRFTLFGIWSIVNVLDTVSNKNLWGWLYYLLYEPKIFETLGKLQFFLPGPIIFRNGLFQKKKKNTLLRIGYQWKFPGG